MIYVSTSNIGDGTEECADCSFYARSKLEQKYDWKTKCLFVVNFVASNIEVSG
jgi:hypothetical protein